MSRKEQILGYLRTHRARFSRSELEAQLRIAGYTEEQIAIAAEEVYSTPEGVGQFGDPELKSTPSGECFVRSVHHIGGDAADLRVEDGDPCSTGCAGIVRRWWPLGLIGIGVLVIVAIGLWYWRSNSQSVAVTDESDQQQEVQQEAQSQEEANQEEGSAEKEEGVRNDADISSDETVQDDRVEQHIAESELLSSPQDRIYLTWIAEAIIPQVKGFFEAQKTIAQEVRDGDAVAADRSLAKIRQHNIALSEQLTRAEPTEHLTFFHERMQALGEGYAESTQFFEEFVENGDDATYLRAVAAMTDASEQIERAYAHYGVQLSDVEAVLEE